MADSKEWFNQARFGMFIHFGLYSILGRGEWAMFMERIPSKEYALLADRFNPKKFDADQIVALAKEAGMKYMVFTARHHDGFCLYDSKVSDFTSVKTAAKRDFVREYVDACKRQGMRVGLYYSLLDWRFPGCFEGPQNNPRSCEAMVKQAHDQVREIMTNYGKIDYLFYDGEWVPGLEFSRNLAGGGASPAIAEFWKAKELNAMARSLQPDILINDRAGLKEDIDTPEQYVIASGAGKLWESCMTIGDHFGWGYIKHNPNLKSTTQLIQYLVSAAAGAGNYLLNIGPKPDGSIQPEFITRIKEMGKWMKVNGGSIYGSERCPLSGSMIGITTAKKNTVYLHVFRWPGEEATVSGVKNNVISATVLATGKKAGVEKRGERLFIRNLPSNPPDINDSVIALELDGKPEAADYQRIPL